MTLSQYYALIDVQARMALKSDASRYYFGYLWWVLEPLLYVGVFYVVFNVILDSRRSDFLIFLVCGKLPFVWFSKSVSQASSSIIANVGLIGKIDVTKTLFPMAVIQEGLYKQAVVFLLLFAILLFTGYMPTMAWFWLIPIMLVNYIMIVACSYVGAVLVCYMRDFTIFIGLGMIFLMFTSGIFWDLRALEPAMAEAVLLYNPMALILDSYRQVLMQNAAPDLVHLAWVGALFGGLTIIMVKLMRFLSKSLALKALTA
ncbi:ABC transporter [Halieaceae bacterium IMCC14734]|uniref:ABC transporter n=1 Tax=Candidatus Litorirhabdus singularis TaxID=2518993 RepID=A0ABT3TEB1_9GAMM|nr:ABC transporter permease [Candidatus Litorirhabdus singularis]MCX2980647.1 ABC transporter [Candidatus Litorirhabdus singularis]